jgi:hypothetical protein
MIREGSSMTHNDSLSPEELMGEALKLDPENYFVHQCKKFYEERGFLSDKQRLHIGLVRKPYPKKYPSQGGDIGDEDWCAPGHDINRS